MLIKLIKFNFVGNDRAHQILITTPNRRGEETIQECPSSDEPPGQQAIAHRLFRVIHVGL